MAEMVCAAQSIQDPRDAMSTSEMSSALVNSVKDLEASAENVSAILFGEQTAKECSGGAAPTSRGVDGDLRGIARGVERVHAVLRRIEHRLNGGPEMLKGYHA